MSFPVQNKTKAIPKPEDATVYSFDSSLSFYNNNKSSCVFFFHYHHQEDLSISLLITTTVKEVKFYNSESKIIKYFILSVS